MKWNAQCIHQQQGAAVRPSVCPSDSSAVEAALEVEVQLQHASLEHGPEARLAVDVPLPVDDLGAERLGQVSSCSSGGVG